MMHWSNLGGIGYGGLSFGWIFMVLFWALIILGIIYFAKQVLSGAGGAIEKESAEDILKKRYAAGEISKDEYHEKMSVITNTF